MTAQEYNKAVDLFADNIYRFVLKHVKNVDAAKDILQETFAKVWVKKDDINAEKIKSYLFTTAHNTLVDLMRKEKYKMDVDSLESSLQASQTQNFDLQKILHDALDQLPEIQRTVILLRDYEGYDYAEIGEITNLNESQVKVYIFRARTKLKQILVSLDVVIDNE